MATKRDTTIEAFGARVRELRDRTGLTQEQLGAQAKVNFKFLGGIERGTENPSLSVILKLASALGVEPRDLFDFEHLHDEKALREQALAMARRATGGDLQRLVKLLTALTR